MHGQRGSLQTHASRRIPPLPAFRRTRSAKSDFNFGTHSNKSDCQKVTPPPDEQIFSCIGLKTPVVILHGDPPVALKLTTDTYWRPSGANIHRHPVSNETDEWDVKPDAGFEIVLKDEERLDFLRAKRNKDIIRKDMKPMEGEKAPVDRVLDSAVAHLKKTLTK